MSRAVASREERSSSVVGRHMKSKSGRPRVTDQPGFNHRFGDILEMLSGENISKRQAALRLGIGHATLLRLLEQVGGSDLVDRNETG